MPILVILAVCMLNINNPDNFNRLNSSDITVRKFAFISLALNISNKLGDVTSSDPRPALRYRVMSLRENRTLTEINSNIHWQADKNSYVDMLMQLLILDDSEEALKLLIACVSLQVQQSVISSGRDFTLGYNYPVASILVKKGERVVPILIDSLASNIEDGRHRRNCCWVLQKLLGNEKCLNVIEVTLPKLDKYRSRSLEQCKVYFKGGEIMPNPSGTVSKYYNIN